MVHSVHRLLSYIKSHLDVMSLICLELNAHTHIVTDLSGIAPTKGLVTHMLPNTYDAGSCSHGDAVSVGNLVLILYFVKTVEI